MFRVRVVMFLSSECHFVFVCFLGNTFIHRLTQWEYGPMSKHLFDLIGGKYYVVLCCVAV